MPFPYLQPLLYFVFNYYQLFLLGANKNKLLLLLSRSKTKYLRINGGNDDETVKMEDTKVPRVKEFKYLRSTVQKSGGCEREIKKRVQAGWNGWRRVSGVICDRRLPARVKRKVYGSVVRPAMVYGLETVAVTKKQVEEMEVAEMKMLRFAME